MLTPEQTARLREFLNHPAGDDLLTLLGNAHAESLFLLMNSKDMCEVFRAQGKVAAAVDLIGLLQTVKRVPDPEG